MEWRRLTWDGTAVVDLGWYGEKMEFNLGRCGLKMETNQRRRGGTKVTYNTTAVTSGQPRQLVLQIE